MSLAVAFHVPHNEGASMGIITGPGFKGDGLVDLFEVDASIESFDDLDAARAWLEEKFENDDEKPELYEVTGGWEATVSYDD